MNDPLAQFRRPGNTATTSAARPSGDKQPYEAYHLAKDERRYLEVRPKFPDSAEAPLNAMITKIVGEWRMGLGVTITYGEVRRRELFHAMLISWTFGLALLWRWWARPRPPGPPA